MIVDAIMHHGTVTIHPSASVHDAARAMRAERVGSVVVVDDDDVVGILTESDIVRVVAERVDAERTRVEEVMSTPVHAIEPSVQMHEAVECMQHHGVTRLVVVLDNEVKGVVTVRDIAYAEPELGRRYLGLLRQGWED